MKQSTWNRRTASEMVAVSHMRRQGLNSRNTSSHLVYLSRSHATSTIFTQLQLCQRIFRLEFSVSSLCSITLIAKLVEEKKEIELQKAAMSSAADLPLLEKKREEATPPSRSSSGDFHHGMNAFFALLFGLKYTTGMENVITLLVVVLVFYFGLMYAAKKLKADPDLKDFGAFTNNISIFFGILALILELLIIVLSYGSVPFFLWTILTVSVVVAVVLLLRLAFVELKEKLKWINDSLMEYCTRLYSGIVASPELIRSDHTTEHKTQDENQMMDHKAQDQNQMIELSPV